mgnify:CR=1 FL=1
MKRDRFLDALAGASDRKIILYVTGGAQDSAFTAGMLAAIAAEGWTDKFHRYIGQSSGSFSLMFFLAGETREGASGYWRALTKAFNGKQLVNPWRLFNPFRSILDLHYLVDEMFDIDPRIPWERVLTHPANRDGRFLVQVLDSRTGKNLLLSRFTTPRALRAAIKASSWIPLTAGFRPFCLGQDLLAEMLVTDLQGNEVRLQELRTYDGGLADSYFGDIYRVRPEDLHLILTTVPGDGRTRLTNSFGPRLLKLERFLSYMLFWWWWHALRAYHASMLNGGQRRDYDELERETLDEHTNVMGVFPAENVNVGRYQLSEASMRKAVLAGFDSLYAAFGRIPVEVSWLNDERKA